MDRQSAGRKVIRYNLEPICFMCVRLRCNLSTGLNVSCTLLAREIKARQSTKTAEGDNASAHPHEINLFHRLSRCFSVCTHFQRITDIVASPRWSYLLLKDVQFEKVISPAPTAVPRFQIDLKVLQELLKDDCQPSNGYSKTALMPEECFGKLAKALKMPRDIVIGMLFDSRPLHDSSLSMLANTLYMPVEGDIHCECLVLDAIHGHPLVPIY